MKDKEWRYKIGGDKVGVVLMFLMSALFVGLTVWLYQTKNGAVLVVSIMATLMVIVFLLTVHRFFFYKVLVGEEGFYYQTNIGNGKFYYYRDIEKAWISSGTAQNGGQNHFCNIVVPGRAAIRFQFFYRDEEAAAYLVDRVKDVSQRFAADAADEKDEYLIDGRAFGKTKIGIGIAIIVIMVSFDAVFIKEVGAFVMLIPSVITTLAIAWLLFNQYFFFQIKIGKRGFYCRTNPFNGRYYAYREITDCREIKKVVRRRRHHWEAGERRYYFFFEFTDVEGKTRKFQFEPDIYGHEINVLKERIEKM